MKQLRLKIKGLMIDVYEKNLIHSIKLDKSVIGQELFKLVKKHRPLKLMLEIGREFMSWIPYFSYLDFRMIKETKTSYILQKHVEWFDAYDENLNKLNASMVRGLPGEEGHYHVTVEVLTVNENNECLVTKRAREKALYPMYYEITGGSVLQGETPEDAAIRELKEETNLRANTKDLVKMHTEIVNDCIYISYLNRGEFAKKTIKLQKGETMDYMWLPYQEFNRFIKGHYFIEASSKRILAYFNQITFETKEDAPQEPAKEHPGQKTLLEVMNSRK